MRKNRLKAEEAERAEEERLKQSHMMPKVAIGSDHAGFEYKEGLKKWLLANGYEVKDFGTHSAESADYPDFAHPVSDAVEKKEFELGVLVCWKCQWCCHHGK